eukprot:SAG31_NODE_6037_length_2197_cov_6.700191_1_plen_312_part_10
MFAFVFASASASASASTSASAQVHARGCGYWAYHSILRAASRELRCDRQFVLTAVAQLTNSNCLDRTVSNCLSFFDDLRQYLPIEIWRDREVALAVLAKLVEIIEKIEPQGTSRYEHRRQYNLRQQVRKFLKTTMDIAVELWFDREFVLGAVAQYGGALAYVQLEELLGDRDIVLAAVAKDGLALHYAAEALLGDHEIVLTAVAKNGMALQYAVDELRCDPQIVLTAVAQDSRALNYAGMELVYGDDVPLEFQSLREEISRLKSQKFMLDALAQSADTFAEWTRFRMELRADKEIVLMAVAQNGEALQHAAP